MEPQKQILSTESAENANKTFDLWYRGPAARPRHLCRLFRADNDEPADQMWYLKEEKAFVCKDGKDRSKCSSCHRSVHTQNPVGHEAEASQSYDNHDMSGYTQISTRRVLRELLVSEVGGPLNVRPREALLAAFDQNPTTDCSGSPTSPSLGTPLDTFPSFPALPFELRHIIWEMALPVRVLQSADLVRPYQPERYSANHTYRSDLIHACTESRRVVEEYENGGRRIGVTSEARLRGSLDVLYCPWIGRRERRSWCHDFKGLDIPLSTIALDVGWLDGRDTDTLEWLAFQDHLARVEFVVADLVLPVDLPETLNDAHREEVRGTDFTVLAGLYDDKRIEELLSLASFRGLNKAARHRCIACTRQAWKARDWAIFGPTFGQRLQEIGYPVILFTVILNSSTMVKH